MFSCFFIYALLAQWSAVRIASQSTDLQLTDSHHSLGPPMLGRHLHRLAPTSFGRGLILHYSQTNWPFQALRFPREHRFVSAFLMYPSAKSSSKPNRWS